MMVTMGTLLTEGPKRLLLGSIWLLLGSIALLIAQQVYVPPPVEEEEDNEDAQPGTDSPATSKTAVALASLVMSFALLTIIFQVLVIRNVKEKEGETQQENEEFRQRQKERGFMERFLEPQFPPTDPTTKRRNEIYCQLSWNSRSRILLMAPSVALFLVIVVRLFLGAGNFEGVPYDLDFGWKYGLLPHDRDVESDGDELYNKPAEKSVAFVVEFNSYGHAMQGFFAALLAFPVVSRFLIQKVSCSDRIHNIWKNLVHLAPWALTIYPSYNLTKRFAKAGEAFAGSSFSNNGFEWAAGFMLALSVGSLITAIVLFVRLYRDEEYEDSDEEEQRVTSSEAPESSASPPWWKVWEPDRVDPDTNEEERQAEQPGVCVKILQFLLGILLLFTVFAAAVLFGLTWHGCLDGSPDECVNYSEDDKAPSNILAAFVVIPSVIFVGVLSLECKR